MTQCIIDVSASLGSLFNSPRWPCDADADDDGVDDDDDDDDDALAERAN